MPHYDETELCHPAGISQSGNKSPLLIRTLTVDDNKIEVFGSEGGEKFVLRDTTRAPQLFEALQCLKPLLLERCEIMETNENQVTVTGLRIGENIRGGWAILAGARGLQRGVLRLETTRLALGTAQTRKRKPLPEHEQYLIRNALHLAALWAAEQRSETCIDPAPPITAAMLALEEKAFLEEFC